MKTFIILPLIIIYISSLQAIAQTCVITCPPNIIIKADSSKGGTQVSYNTVTNSGDCGTIKYTPVSGSFFKVGSTSVIGTTTAGQRCSFTVMVTDNEAPVISPLIFSVQKIWPANGKMKEVAVSYTSVDNADSCLCTLSVSSNDPGGKRSWEIVNNHLVRLAAARLPDGKPRVYTVAVSCTDGAGNTTRRSKSIAVAKNVGRKS